MSRLLTTSTSPCAPILKNRTTHIRVHANLRGVCEDVALDLAAWHAVQGRGLDRAARHGAADGRGQLGRLALGTVADVDAGPRLRRRDRYRAPSPAGADHDDVPVQQRTPVLLRLRASSEPALAHALFDRGDGRAAVRVEGGAAAPAIPDERVGGPDARGQGVGVIRGLQRRGLLSIARVNDACCWLKTLIDSTNKANFVKKFLSSQPTLCGMVTLSPASGTPLRRAVARKEEKSLT